MLNKGQFAIVGDYEICGKVQTCLICLVLGGEELAQNTLEEVLANPPKDAKNIRIFCK